MVYFNDINDLKRIETVLIEQKRKSLTEESANNNKDDENIINKKIKI
jgi:hypothetical protein